MFLTMDAMNVSEAKAKFASLVERAEKGEEIVLCRRNLPVAKIVPSSPPEGEPRHHTRIGWAKDSVRVHGDLNEPAIPESDWEMHQ